MSISVAAPKTPENVKATIRDNNIIIVTCDRPKTFLGRDRNIEARVVKGGTQIRNKTDYKGKCYFEFGDLDYLTSYTVEVCITPC